MALITLGIETSCDDTGAAVYHEKNGLISNALFSQTQLHEQFGGVLPELASRTQLEKINPIIEQALNLAKITLKEIDVIAVTHKPGLPGSLLVGVCFAKAMAWAQEKKIIGINHLEGHIFSTFLENSVPFPHLCLSASGGHTALYIVHDFGNYEIIGETIDDAAGEAFDKIGRLMNLSYPAGPIIEKLAEQAQFQDFFHYPRAMPESLDFSFSGLKTAVLYDLVKHNAYDMKSKTFLKNDDLDFKQRVASSLLVCIGDIFTRKINQTYKKYPHIKAITFVGGVACNNYLKKELMKIAQSHNLLFFAPSNKFCTDNGAMIALVGNYKAAQGNYSGLDLDILR
jgi:N6-L-threonylcarbamoyladenine synthase